MDRSPTLKDQIKQITDILVHLPLMASYSADSYSFICFRSKISVFEVSAAVQNTMKFNGIWFVLLKELKNYMISTSLLVTLNISLTEQ